MNGQGVLEGLVPGLERYRAIQTIARFGAYDFPDCRALFRYAKIKGRLLVFVFAHNGALMSFKANKEAIKAKMRGYYRANAPALKELGIVFNDVHAVVIAQRVSEVARKETSGTFKELARGDFRNGAQNQRLREIFEDIRQTIQGRQ